MRRASTSRAFVAGVVILAMFLSMTVLFGAQGPLAKITCPSAKAKVRGVIEVRAEVDSPRADYAILVVDSDRPGSTNSFPCTFQLDTRELSDGPHRVSVEAYSGFGLIGASKAITIYVKNGSGSVAIAKQPARTQVAARPAPPVKRVTVAGARPKAVTASEPIGAGGGRAAGAVATRPVEPARRVTADLPVGAPFTVAAAEGACTGAATAPTMIGRGPTPEPTRTVVARPVRPRSTAMAEAGAYAFATSGPTAATPPATRTARAMPGGHRGHTVMLDGRAVEFDVVPVIKDGRMHGGFRALFGKIGGRVTWLSNSRTARSVSASMTVEVPTGSRIARVNGKNMDMGAKAEVQNGRTIIPVRFFAETTGSAMAWDGQTGIAYVRTPARSLVKNSN